MPPPFADTRHSGLWQLDCGAADAPYLVFPIASDPVGAGYVDSLPRPGGNATGFMSYEYSMGGKRLELLKQIAPGVTRAAVLRDATQGSGTSEFAAIQAVAPSFGVEVHPVNMREGRGDGRDIRARSSWLILMSGLMGFCLLGGVLALIYKRKMVKPPTI